MTALEDPVQTVPEPVVQPLPGTVLAEQPVAQRPPVARPSRLEPRRLARTGLLVIVGVVGGIVLWLVLLSGFTQARTQRALEQELASQLRDGTAPVNLPLVPGTPLAMLDIPSIGLHEVIVAGTRAPQLADGPGHLRTSAFPGQPGVSVVLGRRTAYGGPFGGLSRLSPGDEVRVTTGQGETQYRVVSVERYGGDDAAAFASATSALLLVTADPPLLASGRLVVRAEPVSSLREPGLRGVQPAPATDELGLAGSSLAAVGVLVWLELLVLVLGATVLLALRWRPWPTWVIATPLLLATAWLTIEHLSLMLPAML